MAIRSFTETPITSYQAIAERRQGYFLYGVALISLTGLVTFAFIVLFINYRYQDLIQISSLILFYTSVLFFVRAKRIELASTLVAIIGAAGYFFVAYGDRVGDSGLLLFNTYPILVFFLLGKRRGLIWTGAFAACMVGAYLLHLFNIFPLAFSPAAFRDCAVSFLVVVAMVYCYQDLINAGEEMIANRDRQLANERDRAQAIVTSIGEGVIVIDEHRRIISLNPTALKLLATSASQAVREPLEDIMSLSVKNRKLHPDKHPGLLPLSTGEVATVNLDDDMYCLLQDNQRFPISIVSAPVAHEGQVTGAVVVFREVSKDKEATEIVERMVAERTREVEEGKARLLASINSLDLGYIMTNDTLSVVMVNHAAFSILTKAGLVSAQPNKQDLSLKSLQQRLSKDTRLTEHIERCLNENTIVRMPDLEFERVYLQITISPIAFERKVVGTVVLIQDVTEAKIIERSKDEFFTIASHELRTPLAIIRGNVSLISSMHSEYMKDPKLSEKIKTIQTACIRLIAIVNDFLSLSRLEQGRMLFNSETFNLLPLVRIVKQDLEPLSKQKKLTISIKASTRLPAVRADSERVKQVLFNLIGNALKFTEKGGVTLTIRQSSKQVMTVQIKDTGVGIPVKNQALLFHKFQQAGDSILTRETSGGTGLGLYISKLIIESMGGTIYLERSELGKGSTFAFTLQAVARE